MKYILSLILTGFLIYALSAAFVFDNAQVNTANFDPVKRTCGTMNVHNMMMSSDPSYKLNHENTEAFIKNFIEKNRDKDNPLLINIPVVVHVVYNINSQNVSIEQINSQIEVLNKDFRKINLDTANIPAPFKTIAADFQLQFCLARRDPNGNPTLGVTRTFTTVTNWGLNSGVKFTSSGGHDAWPNTQYLNMWVCNLGSGLLGYATFPGGNPATDGVVINYTAFGTMGTAGAPFNKGRTATHEIGHWLSLYHIWGDDNGACWGSDNVDDTPNQGPEYYGCPPFPQITCDNGPNGAMYMNYMDYTDDACMYMFTHGQKQRSDAVMNGLRFPLQSSQGCQDISGVPIADFSADSTVIPFGRDVQFTDRSAGIPTQWQWTFAGGNPASSTQQNPNVIYATPGIYPVKLIVINSHGTDTLVKNGLIKVLGAPLSSFNLINPTDGISLNVFPGDTSKVLFNWYRASVHPTIRYKFKIKRVPGVHPEHVIFSNQSGADSLLMLTGHQIDSLAKLVGTQNYDSVRTSWRVYAFNGVDSLISANSFLLTIKNGLIGIQNISTNIPDAFSLEQNYPNPFNPVTKIRFAVPLNKAGVKLQIFNSIGQLVATLVNTADMQPGIYEADWDASGFASGIYYYRLTSSEFTETRKMLLIK